MHHLANFPPCGCLQGYWKRMLGGKLWLGNCSFLLSSLFKLWHTWLCWSMFMLQCSTFLSHLCSLTIILHHYCTTKWSFSAYWYSRLHHISQPQVEMTLQQHIPWNLWNWLVRADVGWDEFESMMNVIQRSTRFAYIHHQNIAHPLFPYVCLCIGTGFHCDYW